jgi:prepilin-type processing-associated H-X9-DG protein
MITPYLGMKVLYDQSPLVFQCPSDGRKRDWGTTRSYSMPFNEGVGWDDGRGSGAGDFQMMGGVFRNTPGWHMIGRSQSEVPAPADTLILVENPQNDNIFANWGGGVCSSVLSQRVWSWGDAWPPPQPTHFDGYNYAFADGHVKWMRPEKTVGTGDAEWEPRGMWTITEGD